MSEAMATCRRCGPRPVEEFYAGGYGAMHKPCIRRMVAERRKKLLATDPAWTAAEAERQRLKEKKRYHEKRKHDPKHKEKAAEARRRYDQRYPDRVQARTAVARAVRKGTLVRPKECSRCNSPGYIEAHHPDYSKPLEVVWLCRQCHGVVSRKV